MPSMALQVFRPFMSITPEVVKPERQISFNQKVAWTAIAFVLYFVMASLPLWGVPQEAQDPLSYLRVITASQYGTLADLGIGPIVTAGLIMQILVGSKMINVDMSDPEDRALYTGAQKVMAVIMTIIEAIAYIVGGAYGRGLSLEVEVAIIAQLVTAGLIIILIDEMVQKGWGLGSGISLFIAGGVSTSIITGLLQPQLLPDNYNRGVLLAISDAIGDRGVLDGIAYMFFRVESPTNSILALIATIVVFLTVIYFESMTVSIPIAYSEYRGMRQQYPIKLLYVSNIPVILVSALFADLYFIAQLVWNVSGQDPNNILVSILGVFEQDETGRLNPKSGLVYLLTPPRGLIGNGAVFDENVGLGVTIPRAIIYAALMIFLSIGFSVMWVETAGMSARDVAQQLIKSGMHVPGWRKNPKTLERLLNMYIPPISIIGGAFIGILSAAADFSGAIGGGIGILLTVSIIRQYFELLAKEQLAEMHPFIRGFLGLS